jgi:hypothetical protein
MIIIYIPLILVHPQFSCNGHPMDNSTFVLKKLVWVCVVGPKCETT